MIDHNNQSLKVKWFIYDEFSYQNYLILLSIFYFFPLNIPINTQACHDPFWWVIPQAVTAKETPPWNYFYFYFYYYPYLYDYYFQKINKNKKIKEIPLGKKHVAGDGRWYLRGDHMVPCHCPFLHLYTLLFYLPFCFTNQFWQGSDSSPRKWWVSLFFFFFSLPPPWYFVSSLKLPRTITCDAMLLWLDIYLVPINPWSWLPPFYIVLVYGGFEFLIGEFVWFWNL